MAKRSSTNPVRLAPNNYLIGAGTAILSLSKLPTEAKNDVGRITAVQHPDPNKGSVEIAFWGADNQLPFSREELVMGNNIVPALIERKRNLICGQGWYAYKERFEDDDEGYMKRIVDEVPMTAEQKAFFKAFKKEAKRMVGEILKHGMGMPELIRDKSGRIGQVRSLEVKYCRALKQNNRGLVEKWAWSNTFQARTDVTAEDRVLIEMPVYNPKSAQAQFVLPLVEDLFNDGYYPMPAYWGGRHWITLSNIIPLFHEANLRHGSSPRFHIVIPYDYFYDYAAMNATVQGSEEYNKLLKTAAEKERQFIKDFNQVMIGVGNTGRPIVTKSEIVESLGGKYDKRIEIHEIKYDMNDTALLELYKASNIANVSAQALHPTLASIETAGKGIGSGTEIRTAFLLYLIIAAPEVRDMLLEVVEVVKSENKWDEDVHFAIRDAEMTTLAENPSGKQIQEPE